MLAKISEFLNRIVGFILQVLPDSPFTDAIDSIENSEVIGYINYFIPVGTMVGILTAWGVAIGVFYAYQMILRWAKAVAD